MKMRLGLSNLLIFLFLIGQAAYAQEKIPWNQLSVEERQVLQQFESQWDSLEPARQLRIRRGVSRLQQMPPEERSQARSQQQRFQSLSREQQQLINQRFLRFNGLQQAEQSRLRNVQERFRNMPQAQRERLIEQFERQSRTGNTDVQRQNPVQTPANQRRIQDVIRQNQRILRQRPTRTPTPTRPTRPR